MAEIGPGIPGRQCLTRRIANINKLTREGAAWEKRRNAADTKANRRFTMGNERMRLRRLYRLIED